MPTVSDGAKLCGVLGESGVGASRTFDSQAGRLVSGADSLQPRWYAAYTNANHEKRVAAQLAERAVEHFLPQYVSERRWKDRRMQLQLPLFPGYVFVRLPLRDRLRILEIPSVVHLVGFGRVASPLPDEEIEGLRRALAEGLRAEPHAHLRVGRSVRIVAGPLAGCEGILKRWKGDMRVLLSIELIQRSVLVDVEASSLVPVNRHKFASVVPENCEAAPNSFQPSEDAGH